MPSTFLIGSISSSSAFGYDHLHAYSQTVMRFAKLAVLRTGHPLCHKAWS
jgi:hypothetical protein